jgi:hypothetical protein
MTHAHYMLDTKATNSHSVCVILLLLRCNNGFGNARQCYVIRTLPVVFRIAFVQQSKWKDLMSRFIYWSKRP